MQLTTIDENLSNYVLLFPEGLGNVALITTDPSITPDANNVLTGKIANYYVITPGGIKPYSRPLSSLIGLEIVLTIDLLINYVESLKPIKQNQFISNSFEAL